MSGNIDYNPAGFDPANLDMFGTRFSVDDIPNPFGLNVIDFNILDPDLNSDPRADPIYEDPAEDSDRHDGSQDLDYGNWWAQVP